jgi:hydrogenase maturation factor HypF (carbamoyltransferase family)
MSFNVLDFGAVGDGKTMNTAAIASAVAAIKKAGGGELYFPAGKALLIRDGKVSKLTVFSAKNKPYLPVGPCSFPDYYRKGKIRDFFFVNKRQVIRNCDDKGGNLWYQAGLFCLYWMICPVKIRSVHHIGMK